MLQFSIGADHDTLELLRPLFPEGFDRPPAGMNSKFAHCYVLNDVGMVLRFLRRRSEAIKAFASLLKICLNERDFTNAWLVTTCLGGVFLDDNQLARSALASNKALHLAEVLEDNEHLAGAYRPLMLSYLGSGHLTEAEWMYEAFSRLPTPQNRAIYRPGDAEVWPCRLRFHQGRLTDQRLDEALAVAESSRNRFQIVELHSLRGELTLACGDFDGASPASNEQSR